MDGKCSWYPYKEHDNGLSAIIRVYDVQLNLIDKNFNGLIFLPRDGFDNYRKHIQMCEYYDCTYTQYIQSIIDQLFDQVNVCECDQQSVNSVIVGDLSFSDQKEFGNQDNFLAGGTYNFGFSVDKAEVHTNSPSLDKRLIIDSFSE